MSTSLESILVQKAKQGNHLAFEKLILDHEKKVYNIAYRMFHNEDDAKDMAQEVFLKVFKSMKKFDEKANFSTWLYRIAVNTCIDEIRKRKGKETYSMDEPFETENSSIKKQYVDESATPEEEYLKKEKVKEVRKAIDQLTEEHKTVIILRDLQDFSYQEIADILSCSLGTVKSRIARARSQLKNLILENRELLKNGIV